MGFILVTGSVGFIGFNLSKKLLDSGISVVGVDNHNEYYDVKIKEARLEILNKFSNYKHYKIDLCDQQSLEEVFKKNKIDKVVNLAAQAGVRYSMENPIAYINSNILGFTHILENCNKYKVEHLVYASTSSVYGANTKMPFSEHDSANHPLSIYAASKKANELMAHSYSHLYKLPATALRFFTVYGPWDRPDMALQKFAKAIINGETIRLFNNGNHLRDFTFIDDIVEGVLRVLNCPAKPKPNWSSDSPDPGSSNVPWKIYNIGNNQPVKLTKYIEVLENCLGKKAKKEFLSIQPGDVPNTWANMDDFVKKFDYKPKNSIEEGVTKFANWFKTYYKI